VQDPERLPDEKRRSFKQELLSATIGLFAFYNKTPFLKERRFVLSIY